MHRALLMSWRTAVNSRTVSVKPRPGPGRPPAGKRPGERVSEYPRLAVRVPTLTLDRLVALAETSGLPQWRVLSDAVDIYISRLPDDQRALLLRLLERAEPLLGQPVRTPHAKPLGEVTVLNVDDNDPMRFARSAILREDGFKVVEAATGRDAIDMLERCNARVVVLDVNLPDMSGLEVCRYIKSSSRWKHVRVLQTSATFSSPHDQLDGLENGGADIYLAEPVPRGTLLSIVRRLAAM
jgi:CheY-like chemotaxis protein